MYTSTISNHLWLYSRSLQGTVPTVSTTVVLLFLVVVPQFIAILLLVWFITLTSTSNWYTPIQVLCVCSSRQRNGCLYNWEGTTCTLQTTPSVLRSTLYSLSTRIITLNKVVLFPVKSLCSERFQWKVYQS
jgi:hypothetical protein